MLLTRRRVLALLGAVAVAPAARLAVWLGRDSAAPKPRTPDDAGPSVYRLPDEQPGQSRTGVGYPTFSLTAGVVSVDGAPPSPATPFEFWVARFSQSLEASNVSPKQSVAGRETAMLVADQAVLTVTDAAYAPTLNNSFTNLWHSTMVGIVCKSGLPFRDTLEIAGTITVTENGAQTPYTARLFAPAAWNGAALPYFGVMAFRLLPDGKFATSVTDANGIAHVWTQARFLQRYMDRIVAVAPTPPRRPSRIQIVQNGNPGDFDRTSWELTYAILRRLGTTTVTAHSEPWPPAEIQRASGIDRFALGLYNPPGYMFPFFPGNPGGASPQVPDAAGIAAWAQSQVDRFKAAGYPDIATLTHIKIADEPAEFQPDVLNAVVQPYGPTTANKMRDEAVRQDALANFRTYLASQRGLTPAAVGYPVGFASVPGPVGRSKEKGTETERALYYWSMRWFSHLASRLYGDCADALRQTIPGIQPAVSLNNYSGMLWKGLVTRAAGADEGQLGHDWHELGRMAGMMGVDDYISEFIISNNALRTASCVRDHPSGKMFSNEVVVSRVGELKGGLLKKVLVNTGRGCDRMQLYVFGPANVNKDGNGAEDLVSGEHAVADYQRLSTWLADTEDDLLAGSPPVPEVAVVAPRSTLMFNGVLNANDSTQGNWWTTTMDYLCEALSLVTTLTHANIESDWMDEDHLGDAARLRRYKVIYLTSPCVPAEYHGVVSAWVADGGTLVTFPGAGAYDRYNGPATAIPGIGGLVESAHTRQSQTNLSITPVLFPIHGTQGDFAANQGTTESWRTVVDPNGGTVEATFADNGNPAMVVKAVGSGRRVHFASFMAQAYFYTGLGTGAVQRLATQGWSNVLRAYLLRPVALAGVVPPVSIDQPLVEGLLLKSDTTTALTLLNWRAEPVTISGTIRGVSAGTRLVGRYGEVPSSRIKGEMAFGPLILDDCDILVARTGRASK